MKAVCNVFDTLKSLCDHYVNYSIIRKCLYFVDFTTFQILGQKFVKFFFGILVQTMTPKVHFETNCPLENQRVGWILSLKKNNSMPVFERDKGTFYSENVCEIVTLPFIRTFFCTWAFISCKYQ